MSIRHRGIVISWNEDNGRGWIELDSGKRIQAIWYQIEMPGFRRLSEGDRVTCCVHEVSLEPEYVYAEQIRVEKQE